MEEQKKYHFGRKIRYGIYIIIMFAATVIVKATPPEGGPTLTDIWYLITCTATMILLTVFISILYIENIKTIKT